MKNLFAILLLSSLLVGCTSTVIPRHVDAAQASWDGTNQNSGLIELVKATNTLGTVTVTGAIITQHANDRYNALMADYGKHWNPPVLPHEGMHQLIPGMWFIDAQHLAYFGIANQMRKDGKPPIK